MNVSDEGVLNTVNFYFGDFFIFFFLHTKRNSQTGSLSVYKRTSQLALPSVHQWQILLFMCVGRLCLGSRGGLRKILFPKRCIKCTKN